MKCNSIILSRVKCQNRVPISVVKFDQFRSNGSALARAIARASFDVCSDAYLRNLRRESFWSSLLLTSAAFHSRVTSGPSSEAKSGALNIGLALPLSYQKSPPLIPQAPHRAFPIGLPPDEASQHPAQRTPARAQQAVRARSPIRSINSLLGIPRLRQTRVLTSILLDPR